MFVLMLIAYSLVFALIATVATHAEWKKHYIWVKALNSFAFVVIFFVSAYISMEVHQFWLMMPAFFCCFVGDVFMAAYNRFRKRVHFLMGLGIFLAGHLCFARWLCTIQRLTWTDLILPVLAVLFAWYLVSLKSVHTGRIKPFIIIYAFFVALVLDKGLALAVANPSTATFMVAVGTILFFVSDVSIVFLYFQKRKSAGVHLFNLATYYYGVFLLATHLLFL